MTSIVNDFIGNLYATKLGRQSDPSGRAYWEGQLASGKTQQEVEALRASGNKREALVADALDTEEVSNI